MLSTRKLKDSAYLLIVHYHESATDEVKLNLNKLSHKLKSKTVRKDQIELTVEVKIRNDNTAFVSEISSLNGVRDAVLVSYNGDYAP
ncbi:hypothetical protein D3C81_2118130 [compost metagenome]